MKEQVGICPYCMGCNKQELENFNGVYRCKNFVPNQINWEQNFRENIKKKGEENGKKI